MCKKVLSFYSNVLLLGLSSSPKHFYSLDQHSVRSPTLLLSCVLLIRSSLFAPNTPQTFLYFTPVPTSQHAVNAKYLSSYFVVHYEKFRDWKKSWMLRTKHRFGTVDTIDTIKAPRTGWPKSCLKDKTSFAQKLILKKSKWFKKKKRQRPFEMDGVGDNVMMWSCKNSTKKLSKFDKKFLKFGRETVRRDTFDQSLKFQTSWWSFKSTKNCKVLENRIPKYICWDR